MQIKCTTTTNNNNIIVNIGTALYKLYEHNFECKRKNLSLKKREVIGKYVYYMFIIIILKSTWLHITSTNIYIGI